MEKYKPEHQQNEIGEEVSELIDNLSKNFDERLEVDFMDGTHIIEGDNFTLSVALNDQIFQIRSIDVRGNSGVGHQVVDTVHSFADENDFEVVACNVVDTAHGFWEKMGYQESEVEGEYFRPS